MLACDGPHRSQPAAIDGVLDLSDWDFERDGFVELAGEWRFVWNDFIKPMPVDAFRARYGGVIKVPAAMWHQQPHPDRPGEMLPGTGFATYSLKVNLPRDMNASKLALYGRNQGGSVDWLVLSDDGSMTLGREMQGKVGRSADEAINFQNYALFGFSADGHQSLHITAHLSNFDWARGGFWLSPYLGTEKEIRQGKIRAFLTEAIIFGICIITALYHLIVFFQRREDASNLFFACLCGSIALRQWLTGRFFEELGVEPSRVAYDVMMSLEWVTMVLMILFAALFIEALVPSRRFQRFVRIWCVGLGTLVMAILLLTPPITYSPYSDYIQLYTLGTGFALIGYLTYRSLRGNVIGRWLLASMAFTLVAGVNDVLTARALIDTPYLIPYAFVACILAQSAILSGRAAFAHKRVKHLSENLQREVDSQTEDLKVKAREAEEARLDALQAKEEADQLRKDAEVHSEELEVLDQQKTAFFQNMSHELRTPLTLILGPLEESTKRHTEDEDLVIATNNARRLLRLVNQLLEFQKLGAGKKELQLAPLNLNRFTHVLGDYFASACSSKDIELHVTRDGQTLVRDAQLTIESEKDALEKVAFNFLSNALKYTPRGGRIELGIETQEDTRVRLFVSDSGPGISEEGQSKLFQVFSQVEESTTREYEGTGLGLALVKSLVEEMHGEVGVESTPGNGSTFYAEFPIVDLDIDTDGEEAFQARDWLLADGHETGVDADVEDETDVSVESEGKGQLVLIVDDLEDMRTLIGKSLKRRGYRVLKAANGEQGYDVICDRKPELIISDWMMPKLSGPDMLKKVRANPEVATTPVILLTAKSDEESKLIGTEIGADVFLGKPFNDQELGSAVRNLLSLKSREKEVQRLNDYITESVLKRYLPPTLIGEILSGNLSMDKPAELRDVTVLFSDLKGFTTTSEALGPEGISAFLNEYLTVMNEVIFEHGGTIDKFIGDAIMVLFGAPQEMSAAEQVTCAAECAKAMQRTMDGITQMWQAEGAGHLQMRIGIHHGKAVVGNFGSKQRSDYTAIGPTVNMAARIESAGEAGEVFVSEATASLMDDGATSPVGEFALKGIEGKVRLFKVVGL